MKHQLYDRDMYHPVTSQHNAKMYRVPMWIDGDEYMVAIGQSHYRNYTDETLPDIIKARLSMIRAFPPHVLPYYMVNALVPYINHHDPRLDEIGWQVTQEMYMLVMSYDDLMEINNDARTKS